MSQFDKEFIRKTTDKRADVSLVTEKTDGRGKHPNSQANLEPWEKGESGNPDGRPSKYIKLKEALDMYGDRLASQFDTETFKEAVLHKIWYEASMGSISHIKMLAELGCLDKDA